MILNFTAIDREGNLRNFSWWFSSFDYSLDVLSSAYLKGNQIVKAEIIDNENRIQLPVEAFDGKALSIPFRSLESQWQRLLAGKCVKVNFNELHSFTLDEKRDN